MRSQVTDPETSSGDARPASVRRPSPPARSDARATPIILPAIVMRAAPGPRSDWPVLVAARRATEEAWTDFLDGDASVYDLMRARNRLEVICRRVSSIPR